MRLAKPKVKPPLPQQMKRVLSQKEQVKTKLKTLSFSPFIQAENLPNNGMDLNDFTPKED